MENEPLGTGGAIKKSLSFVNSNDIFILNGLPFDSYFIDIGIPEDYEKAKREMNK